MVILPMSDLHGYLPPVDTLPKCDVACICGDIVPLEYQSDDAASIAWFCLNFVPWTDDLVRDLGCKKVLLVAGNHDFFLEHIMYGPVREDGSRKIRSASEVLKKLLPGEMKGRHSIVYLRDNSVEIEGKRFYGTPWCASLKNWAFYESDEDLRATYSVIPKSVDVLLTHMPPDLAMMGTVLQRGQFNTGTNYGSKILAEKILDRDIHYTFCGHVHSGCHIPSLINTSNEGRQNWVVNVSVKDENYKVQTFYFPIFEI